MVGVGVDVAEVGRFERLIGRGDGRAWVHWYTEAETQECRRHPRPAEAATVRFAVKEAIYKALGASFTGAVRWRDIEVLGEEPSWRIELHGEIELTAAAAGVGTVHVSTGRSGHRVMAMVIAERMGS